MSPCPDASTVPEAQTIRPSVVTPSGVVEPQAAAGAMSTETFIFDVLASVKITPLTGGTSP